MRGGVVLLGVLTVVVQAGVVGALGLTVAGRWWTAARRAHVAIARRVAGSAVVLAALVAVVATGGSLYLSEVAHFTPCALCWYQRCAMYPLAVLLSLAAWRREQTIRPYVLALASLGLAVSTYHYLVEWFPELEGSACDPTNPCALVWVRLFGYMSIPMMAGTAFVAIGGLMWLSGAAPRRSPGPQRPQPSSLEEPTHAGPMARA